MGILLGFLIVKSSREKISFLSLPALSAAARPVAGSCLAPGVTWNMEAAFGTTKGVFDCPGAVLRYSKCLTGLIGGLRRILFPG